MISICLVPAHAQEIYKVVNKDGSITYTDKPVPEAQPVELGPDNRITVPPPKPTLPPVQTSTEKKAPDPVIEVIAPQPEATVRNNSGNMTIAANVTHADKQGKYQLFINNQLIMEQSKPLFYVNGINRGAHTFYIAHTDNKGKTLASSSPQTFYLHQASRLINN
ncbi:DUF4124 domain-containing protein [Alteromonas lipolytica]|uniref:DUF4124 domain-containing protein n=1 Tax=Alteromonas lipolytica TaxID=1856405 RepID=UPI00166E546A|nr:DUF4124 domain-containing protein [Alteromonas lipolytica]GGF73367.1 hypothetical protein GCM10011338_26880 [Alteromonas lipolytica]